MEAMELTDQQSFYDAVGGAETFNAIVSRFYALVREDEILRPLYPEDEQAAAIIMTAEANTRTLDRIRPS